MKAVIFLILIFLTVKAYPASVQTIDLSLKQFQHVTFKDIPTTHYENDGSSLAITVDKSSSFLLLPFSQPQTVRAVAFSWRGSGVVKVPDAKTEQTKQGDDGRLRIGLLLVGKPPMVPFLAPTWIKTVRDIMKVPSDRIVYLAVDTKNPPPAKWTSPHSSDIEIQAIPSETLGDGWWRSHMTFNKTLSVGGLWITADGDNTGSTFKTWLKDLVLTADTF